LCFLLDQLVSSGLVARRGLPPDATYTFKHALVQTVAYESMLKTRRSPSVITNRTVSDGK
jgi:predicted ATPase